MTISRKIALGFSLPLLILMVIGAVTYRTTAELIDRSALVAHTHEVIETTSQMLQRIVDGETGVRGYVATGAEAFLDPYRAADSDVTRLLQKARELTEDNPTEQKALRELEPLVAERFGHFKELIETRKKQAGDAAFWVEPLGRGKQNMDRIRQVIGGMGDTEHELLRQRDRESRESAKAAVSVIIGGTLLGILVAAIAGLLITQSITRALRALAGGVEKVGAGELGYRIELVTRDELGVLAAAFNRMTERRQQMEELVKRQSAERERVLLAVTESSQRLAAAATELLSSTTHQSSGAQEQSAAVAETVAIVEEVAQTSNQASERARSVAEIAQQSSEISSAGRSSVEEVQSTLQAVNDQSAATAEVILALAERTQAIGEIIATVNDLAEQTNLLALNAAIEASRAGEHGKGFSVVAGEVKALADQSKKSTVQVRQILGEIQKTANKAVIATEESTKSMSVAVKKAVDAGETIRKLTEVIEQSAQKASQIAASAGQQATGLQQINQAMKDINKATSQTLASTRQVEQAARDLNAIGVNLKELLSASS